MSRILDPDLAISKLSKELAYEAAEFLSAAIKSFIS